MIGLEERLSRAEGLAGRCARVVDVGTNHGFLPVHMLQTGLCERAVLADVSADALEKARALVQREGLERVAQLLVTDGLMGIELVPQDVVTVCGMGARTILSILPAAVCCPVVVQANVEIPLLRRHLVSIGMHIVREDIALDKGRFYVLLRAEPGAEDPMDEDEAELGRCLLRDRPERLKEYLLWRRDVTQRALEGGRLGRDPEKREKSERAAQAVLRALEEVQ